MGVFSWLNSCGTTTKEEDPTSLIRVNYANPHLEEIREAAAEDVALIEQDGKRPGSDRPDESGGLDGRPDQSGGRLGEH